MARCSPATVLPAMRGCGAISNGIFDRHGKRMLRHDERSLLPLVREFDTIAQRFAVALGAPSTKEREAQAVTSSPPLDLSALINTQLHKPLSTKMTRFVQLVKAIAPEKVEAAEGIRTIMATRHSHTNHASGGVDAPTLIR